MNVSRSKFWRGFLQGSLLGCGLLAFGMFSWGAAVVIGFEKDKSLVGFSLTPLYVLSFGLGGGVLYLLRKDHSRWYESAFAWGVALAVVLLGCSVMALQLESERPIEWFWGAGSATAFIVLLAASLIRVRRDAEPGAAPKGGPATPAGNSGVAEGPPSVS